MKRVMLLCVLLVACGKSTEERAREEAEREAKAKEAANPPAKPAEAQKGSAEAPASKPDEKPPIPEPDPTKPEEVDKARKQAMIDGKDKDVIRFCEMTKFDDKTDPNALLGCTLAACRMKDEAKAKSFSAPLLLPKNKPYLEQARKVCLPAGVGL
jgi:hypothetical protein